MKIGDHVIFIGVTDVQVKWGSNNDPREIMKEGDINPKLKNVSEVDLKKALHELHEKQELDRRQAQIDLNNAFRDGFRCGKTL